MKKCLLLLLLTFPLFFFSCSGSDDEETDEKEQDYTSYVIKINADIYLDNAVTGYFDSNGLCKKLYEHGNLTSSSQTKEMVIPDQIEEIFLFYNQKGTAYGERSRLPYKIKKFTKNIIDINAPIVPLPLFGLNEYNWPQ